MKRLMKILAVVTLVGATLQTALAEVEVPFVFQSGQPAKASEVNSNFATVVTGVNANGSAIAANSASIMANAVQIGNVNTLVAANASAISTNGTDILANTTAIATNSTGVATNASNIAGNSSAISSNSQAIASLTTTVDGHTQEISAIGDAVAGLNPPPPYFFIGYSTAQVDGNVGYFGMLGACQADFGPTARMASSYEIISSATIPTVRPNMAWVRPSSISVAVISTIVRLYEFSGAYAQTSLSCEGYKGSGEGLAIDNNGAFHPIGCAAVIPVACSVPQ